MKKIMSIAVVLIILTALVPAAYAADTAVYDLPELNLSVDVPADWITFTRDIEENDPNLALFGTTAEAMVSDYESKNIYLNSVCLEPLSEIVITMVADDGSKEVFDFNNISDEDMPETVETIKDEMQKLMGDAATYAGTGMYTHAQAKFAIFNFETGGELPDHGQQYTTVINGQTINITLHSYTGELTADQEQLIKDVVDSITFTEVKTKPGIDLSHAATTGLIGAVGGGIVAAIVVLINRSKRKKAAQAAALIISFPTIRHTEARRDNPEKSRYFN
jgi:hypothetical protein